MNMPTNFSQIVAKIGVLASAAAMVLVSPVALGHTDFPDLSITTLSPKTGGPNPSPIPDPVFLNGGTGVRPGGLDPLHPDPQDIVKFLGGEGGNVESEFVVFPRSPIEPPAGPQFTMVDGGVPLSGFSSIPSPGPASLIGLGLLAGLRRRRR